MLTLSTKVPLRRDFFIGLGFLFEGERIPREKMNSPMLNTFCSLPLQLLKQFQLKDYIP